MLFALLVTFALASPWSDAFNAALSELVADGTYDELWDTIFPDTEQLAPLPTCSGTWPAKDDLFDRDDVDCFVRIGAFPEATSFFVTTILGNQIQGFNADLTHAVFQHVVAHYNAAAAESSSSSSDDKCAHIWIADVTVPREASGFFPSIRDALNAGAYDISVLDVTRTDAREEEVDFTCPVAVVYEGVIIRADAPTTVEGLNEPTVKIGVTSGSTWEAAAGRVFPSADIVVYNSGQAMLDAFEAGDIDAHFFDFPNRQVCSGCSSIVPLEPENQYFFAMPTKQTTAEAESSSSSE